MPPRADPQHGCLSTLNRPGRRVSTVRFHPLEQRRPVLFPEFRIKRRDVAVVIDEAEHVGRIDAGISQQLLGVPAPLLGVVDQVLHAVDLVLLGTNLAGVGAPDLDGLGDADLAAGVEETGHCSNCPPRSRAGVLRI